MPTPCIGMKVDDAYRDRVPSFVEKLMLKGNEFEIELNVRLLDNLENINQARQEGTLFYPWKK